MLVVSGFRVRTHHEVRRSCFSAPHRMLPMVAFAAGRPLASHPVRPQTKKPTTRVGLFSLDGVAGFEPADDRIKICCLAA